MVSRKQRLWKIELLKRFNAGDAVCKEAEWYHQTDAPAIARAQPN
jgi:hypothetical protein